MASRPAAFPPSWVVARPGRGRGLPCGRPTRSPMRAGGRVGRPGRGQGPGGRWVVGRVRRGSGCSAGGRGTRVSGPLSLSRVHRCTGNRQEGPVVITVVRGNPTPEELAAAIAATLAALRGRAAAPEPARANAWAAPRPPRPLPAPGPHAWRTSFWPG
ncbi:hypothetical protein FH609_016980 [Streptomyces sp. 3MP-14]|uniref:Acyl-CoA carboxylase subunit epsilon n=1 Tax=Streptomyces mimosae TaxID=2586635 RepID=A0A5N6A8X3_9ACTN|nr:hypothetical protein FH607_014305 [Streptomyces mimosae]KAB8175899.1 hypothetical protein FH609_016980 [Streptomyces sp. 3MP-14]